MFLCYTGSRAYGLAHEEADHDLVGVYVAPRSHYLGLSQVEETVRIQKDPYDITHYELRHYFRLLLKGNPNLLWTLWSGKDIQTWIDWIFEKVIENRQVFASKLAYNSHIRYAERQFERLARSARENREALRRIEEFDAELEHRRIHNKPSTSYLRVLPTLHIKNLREGQRTTINGLGLGDKRRDVIIKHGYDTNQAAHLVRLLRMCTEFLREGRFYIDRQDNDAEQLKAIKAGEWSLEGVTDLFEVLREQARDAHEQSYLPDEPDYHAAEKLLMWAVEKCA